MIWTNILKIKIRPADKALSPTVQDFLRPTRSDETTARYKKDTKDYAFNITNQTPEQIAQIIAEETTHHAQDIIGELDPDYKQYHVNFKEDIHAMTKLILPIAIAKKVGNNDAIQQLTEIYTNHFFNLLYKQIQENLILESHAKESENLEPVAKTIDLFTNYVTQVTNVYLSLLPEQLKNAEVPEILKFMMPAYNIFKTKLSSLVRKTIDSIVTESLANRKAEFRDRAVEAMGQPVEALKTKVVKFILDDVDETMESVRRELNA
tara:strand:+ start:292 stop:1083 length:792 start_codon:yes stop_codon:yes gene_type:complete